MIFTDKLIEIYNGNKYIRYKCIIKNMKEDVALWVFGFGLGLKYRIRSLK